MMLCDVVLCTDLSRSIEKNTYEIKDMTLSEFISAEVENYNPEKPLFFSVYADGVKIPFSLWHHFNLNQTKSLKIVIEALGDPFTWVAIIVTIAAAVYSAYMMHKLSAKTGTSTKTGSSIYDVNAQGNQVKLNEVIPEHFGLLKRFPDYIADTHRFYSNNKRILDLSLSQGVGEFSHTENGSDMYIGNTPFNLMSEKIRFKVYDPGETLSENDISPELGFCWFNSLEISASGKELENPKQNTTDSDLVWVFSDFFCVMNKKSRKWIDKGWKKGDILKILEPTDVYLFGDSMEYRANEWVYQNSSGSSNYETEIKDPLYNSTARSKYLFGPVHGTNFNLISAAAAADPDHSRFGLLGEHYNDSGLHYFNYYDNNEFCDCWGLGYVNTDSYAAANEFIRFETEAFTYSSFYNSPVYAALWDQITDPRTENQTTNGIYLRIKYGYTYHRNHDNIAGSYLDDGYTEFQGRLAVWDYAPGYSSPGNWSQFWNRDSTNALSGSNVENERIKWQNKQGFSTYDLYSRMGVVYSSDQSRFFKKIPFGYSDFEDVNSNNSQYCYWASVYIKAPQREENYFRIIEVKEVESNRSYFWGFDGYSPYYSSYYRYKVKLYKVRKCDSSGNISSDWKHFFSSYSCLLGSDIVKEDETREEGFNVSVFDHVD